MHAIIQFKNVNLRDAVGDAGVCLPLDCLRAACSQHAYGLGTKYITQSHALPYTACACPLAFPKS